MAISASWVRKLIGGGIALAMLFLVAPTSAEAKTLAEVEKIRDEVVADLKEAADCSGLFANFCRAWWLGWATGRAAVELGWAGTFLVTTSSTPSIGADDPIDFGLPAVIPGSAAVIGTNAELASLFGLGAISPLLENALNAAMVADTQVVDAVASFMLAERRYRAAAAANDQVSAAARFGEMTAFKAQAVADEPAATVAWTALRAALVAEPEDIDFLAVDTEIMQLNLQSNGSAAFPVGTLPALANLGFTPVLIDNFLIPNLIANPALDQTMIGNIDLTLQSYADLDSSLQIIVDSILNPLPVLPQGGILILCLLITGVGALGAWRARAALA